MNNPKHTPGPWTVEYRQDGKLGIKAGSACLIATIGRQAASHVDNAYLIAAAPELLSLLERVIKANGANHVLELKRECLEAIAKATGESND